MVRRAFLIHRAQFAPDRLNHMLFLPSSQVGSQDRPGDRLASKLPRAVRSERPLTNTRDIMRTELVKATTSDGLRLDGSLQEPARCRATSEAPDAYLLLHGVGGTFYGGNMFDALTQPLLNQTAAVLRVNTRGAGAVSMFATNGGATRGGAAFEVVDQCRYDIAAWCDFLVARGYQRIALLGHSLGAIKALYATAHSRHPQVTHVIAASPPRLSYAAFQHDSRSSLFFESLRHAERLVAEGQPETIFTAKFPFPLLITAASYLDKYGPEERYNLLRFVDQITVPTLFVYGEQELATGGTAFAGLPTALIERTTAEHDFTVDEIPDADHFYTGCYPQLAQAITAWVIR